MLFAAVFRVTSILAQAFGLSPSVQADMLIAGPKVLQGIIAALTDFFTWRLSQKLYPLNHRVSLATLALTVCSPWNWFCGPRTLSNSVETCLTSAALNSWPLEAFTRGSKARSSNDTVRLRLALALAALATVLRPTNVLIWVVVALTSMYLAWTRQGSQSLQILGLLLREAAVSGSAILILSSIADRIYYQQWTFPPFRFIHFNVVQSLAVFYGQNRPDYYFTEGLPLLLTTALPFAVLGLWQGLFGKTTRTDEATVFRSTSLRIFSTTCIAMIIALSLISHKEVRFIYPLLPILLILASAPVATFFSPFPRPGSSLKKALLALLLALNITLAAYITFIHQRGVIDVLHYLRHEYETHHLPSKQTSLFDPNVSNMTVGFLMPCHSTPWRSHLIHPGIQAWALTCEPPLEVPIAERGSYLDEADQFYADPASFLLENMEVLPHYMTNEVTTLQVATGTRAWPEYLVFFEQLEPVMRILLKGSRYHECWRGFNTHFHDDSRRKGDVIVWCQRA